MEPTIAREEMIEEESYGDSVIGNVEGRVCIIIDDLVDGANPFGSILSFFVLFSWSVFLCSPILVSKEEEEKHFVHITFPLLFSSCRRQAFEAQGRIEDLPYCDPRYSVR